MILPALLLCALISGVPATAPSETDLAQEQFGKGRQLFKERAFAPALEAFTQARAQVDSPNVTLYIGRCLVELGRLLEGHAELGRAEAEATALAPRDPRYQATAQAALEERRALRARLGALRVKLSGAPPSAQVRVAGRLLASSELEQEVLVVPGPVPVAVDAPGFARLSQTLVVAAAQHQELAIVLEPLPPAPPTVPKAIAPVAVATEERAPGWSGTLLFTGLAVGAGGGLAAGGLAVATRQQHQSYVAACVSTGCPDDTAKRLATSGRRLQTLTNIALGVGIAGATGALAAVLVGRVFSEPVPVSLGTDGRLLLVAGRY